MTNALGEAKTLIGIRMHQVTVARWASKASGQPYTEAHLSNRGGHWFSQIVRNQATPIDMDAVMKPRDTDDDDPPCTQF